MIPDGSFPLETTTEPNTILGPVPGNYFISRDRTQYIHRRYRITWKALDSSDLATLLAQFDAAKGGAGTTQIAHPDDGVLTVRFVDDSLQVIRRSPRLASATVVVEPEGPV